MGSKLLSSPCLMLVTISDTSDCGSRFRWWSKSIDASISAKIRPFKWPSVRKFWLKFSNTKKILSIPIPSNCDCVLISNRSPFLSSTIPESSICPPMACKDNFLVTARRSFTCRSPLMWRGLKRRNFRERMSQLNLRFKPPGISNAYCSSRGFSLSSNANSSSRSMRSAFKSDSIFRGSFFLNK